MPTMVSGGSTKASHGSLSGHAKENYIVPVAFDVNATVICPQDDVTGVIKSQGRGTMGVTHTLRGEGFDASEDGTGRGTPLVTCFAQNTRDEVREMPYSGTLSANPGMKQTSYVRQGLAVRRLTPTECERLQGFSDNHTQIPWRGKTPEDCPDGPRYKAIGNSKAEPVVRWLGKRILTEITGRVSRRDSS